MTIALRAPRLLRGSLQKRVILPLCLGGVIAVAMGAVLVTVTAERLLHRQMEERARLITTTLNHMAMVVHDWTEMQHVIEQLSAADEVEAVTVILSTNQRVVSATDPSWVGQSVSDLPNTHIRQHLLSALHRSAGHTHTHQTRTGRPVLVMLSPLHDPSIHDRSIHGRPQGDAQATQGEHATHGHMSSGSPEPAAEGDYIRGVVLLMLNERGVDLTASEILERTILGLSFVAMVTAFIAFLFLKFDVLRRIAKLKSAMLTRKLDENRTVAPRLGDDEIGEIARTYNELLDVLDQRQDRLREAKSQLATALEEAQSLSRAKSEFVANMSHELRTPLNAVIGYSEALEHNIVGKLTDGQSEYVRIIHLSGQHLLYLINNLLDYAKIDSGKVQLKEAPVDLQQVLDEAVSMTLMSGRKAGLTINCDPAVPLPLVYADRRALFQVVLNLLSNAIKFTPEGGTVDVVAALDDGLTITVRDSGIGISPDQIERVFEPFYHGSAENGCNHEGTGLGLTIVRSLVEAHGGTVAIESSIDDGTSVNITLPRARFMAEAVAV